MHRYADIQTNPRGRSGQRLSSRSMLADPIMLVVAVACTAAAAFLATIFALLALLDCRWRHQRYRQDVHNLALEHQERAAKL